LLLYSLSISLFTYLISFILNKIYNRKSEKKFNKIIQKVSYNIKLGIGDWGYIQKNLEEYRGKYISTSLNLLSKIHDKM